MTILPESVSEAELDAMLDRWAATTPGPWQSFVEGRDHECGSDFIMTGPPGSRGEGFEISGASTADLDFIAHAKQDVPLLVAEIRRLRSLLPR